MGDIRQDDRFIWFRIVTGLDAPSPGAWVELKGRHPVTVTVEGVFTGTYEVMVSCNPERPLDSFTGAPIFDGVTHNAPARVTIDAAVQWLKINVPTLSAGSLSAFVLGGPGPNAC